MTATDAQREAIAAYAKAYQEADLTKRTAEYATHSAGIAEHNKKNAWLAARATGLPIGIYSVNGAAVVVKDSLDCPDVLPFVQ